MAKLPAMLILSFVAVVFMAWLDYVPYIIFFIWLSLTYYTLPVMTETKFEHEADMRMNKPVFYSSPYLYVVMACVLAWLFQVEILTGDPAGPGMPLWKYMVGLK